MSDAERLQLHSTITCPHCAAKSTEPMPTDACQVFYECQGCQTMLRPHRGDCCVFCSFGTVPCPPIQEQQHAKGKRGSDHDWSFRMTSPESCQSKDWVSDPRSYVIAWGLPRVLLLVGIFLDPLPRIVMWAGALVWKGLACLANAARCGRTHCYFTGPYFLGLAIVTVLHGLQFIWLGMYGWLWLGLAIVAGGTVLWFVTEKMWGKFRGFKSLPRPR